MVYLEFGLAIPKSGGEKVYVSISIDPNNQ